MNTTYANEHLSDALTWIERNVPDGVALVARALSETYPEASRASPPPDLAAGEHPCDGCGRPTKMEPDAASGIILCAECICRNAGVDPVAAWDRIRGRLMVEHGLDVGAAGSSAPRPAPEVVRAKNQPCGCVVCTCHNEDEPDRCLGCGAKNCGTPECVFKIGGEVLVPVEGAPEGHADDPGCDDCGLTRVPFWFHSATGRRTCLDCTKKRDALSSRSGSGREG